MDCRPSSERSGARPRRWLWLWMALLSAGLCGVGCSTVRPQDKELLADPAMVYGSGGEASRQEAHVLENREAASSGSAGGGGCGCN